MSQIEGIADEVPVEGFSGVLDTLYATAVGNPDRAGDPQKQPLSQALNPVPEFQELAPVE
jgi:hypothetical protein